MKKIFLSLLSCLLMLSSYAQIDRSKQPTAGPAPVPEFGTYKLFTLDNGLKIIVVENDKLPRVRMNLVLDRDPIFEGDKAGYVSLAGELLREGTLLNDKATLDEKIDFMGASINTSSTGVFGSGLSKYTEDILSLMSEITLQPSFPQEGFDKLKTQTISGIESNKEDASAINGSLYRAMNYGLDHPYGEMMSIENVENVTIDDCKAYYKKYFIPNTAYLVVVGDVKAKKIKKLAKKYFSEWAMGEKVELTYPDAPKNTQVEIGLVNRESAVQSVIELGNTINLKPGAEDIVAVNLMNQILGGGSIGRLFQNIREDKGYTYGAYSDYSSDELVGNFSASASVRNDVTDSSIVEFIKEFVRIQNEPVGDEELQSAKNFLNGQFGRSLSSPSTIASFALNIERYNLPEDYYQTYLTRINALTAEDIMNAAKKYIEIDKLNIAITCKAGMIAPTLEKFGNITFYDTEGMPTDAPSLPIPAGITIDTVMANYIQAIGGQKNIGAVKDYTLTGSLEAPGAPMALDYVMMAKAPNMSLTAIKMGGQVFQKSTFNGKAGMETSPMGSEEYDAEAIAEKSYSETMFLETKYTEMGASLNLTSIAMIEGEQAYVVEVTDPNGKMTTDYYSVENGLKIQSSSSEETPQGPMVISMVLSNYKEVKGVMFPFTMTQLVAGQKIVIDIKEVKVNTGLKSSEFAAK